MRTKTMALGAALAVLAGCGLDPVVMQVGGGAAPSRSLEAPLTGEAGFALEVARAASAGPLETVTGNWHLRGFYTGARQGCDEVSIHNLDINRTTHYRVCAGVARERAEVAPSHPGGDDAERVRRSVMDAAWREGRATQQWEAYRVSGVRIGPPRSDGCATISTMITYEGMLIRHDDALICH